MAINPGDPVGVIESLEGGLVVFRDDGSEAYLQVGDQVSMYDQVFTDPNSSATIRFNDGTSLDIADDSSVFVDEYIYDPEAESTAQADAPAVPVDAPSLDLSLDQTPASPEPTPTAQTDDIVPDNVAGIIESMTGQAIVIRADGSQETIRQGDFVFNNDELFTEGNSALSVRFVDETSFSIGEDSSLVIDEFVYDEQTGEGVVDVSVVKGLFVFISGIVADNNPENMTIKTPGTTIGIRGTEGMGKVGQNGEESYYVNTDGIITISTATGTVVIDQINETAVVLSPSLPPQMAKEWSSAQVLETFISALRVAPLSLTQRLVDADVSLGSSARSVLNNAIKAVKKAEAEQQEADTGKGDGTGDGTQNNNNNDEPKPEDKPIDDSGAEEIVQAVVFSFADDEAQEEKEQETLKEDTEAKDAEELIAEVEQQLVELAKEESIETAIETVVVEQQEEEEAEEIENLGPPAVAVSGIAVDGYLANADVFFDENGNGLQDPDEVGTTTDDSGNFNLEIPQGATGSLVIVPNGTDVLTGESFAFTLRAPITAEDGLNTVVSPLSTLVDSLVAGGQSVEQALQTVAAIAGTNAAGLLARDPIAEATANPASVDLLQAAISVQTVITVLGASLAGASGSSLAEAGDAILEAFAANPGVLLGDTSSNDFAQILTQAATNLGANISEAEATAAGQLTSITLAAADVSDSGLSANAQLGRLAQVSELLQASLVTDIQQASSNGNLATQFVAIIENGSVDSLLAQIDGDDLGQLIPGQAFNFDAVNFAPQLQTSQVTVAPIAANTPAPDGDVGFQVSSILADVVTSDGDGAVAGIGISSLNGEGTWFFSIDGGESWSTVSPESGSVLLLAADARLYFQPIQDDTGSAVSGIQFHAWDGTAGSSGASITANTGGASALSEDVAIANIDVIANPIDVPQAITEGQSTTLSAASFDASIIGNASDITVQFSGITGGIIVNTLEPEQAISEASLAQIVNGDIAFSHDGSEGTPAVIFTLVGASLAFQAVAADIDFTPVNDAPEAVDDAYGTDEDQTLSVDADNGLLANDSDAEGDALSAELILGPTNGEVTVNDDGSFDYQPAADFFGTDSFTYRVTDAAGASREAQAIITVNSVNDAPSAVLDDYQIDEDNTLVVAAAEGLLNNDADDGVSLTVSLLEGSGPQNGQLILAEDGSFEYTPDENFNGEDSFTYVVTDDDGASSQATVTIDVQAVNDAPVVFNDSFLISEDQMDVVLDLFAGEGDPEGDQVSIALDAAGSSGIFRQEDTRVLYTPNASFQSLAEGEFGADSFFYTMTDENGLSSVATVSIVIEGVNDAPVANDVVVEGLFEGDAGVQVFVLENDTDAESDALSLFDIDDSELSGTVSFDATSLSYQLPDLDFLAAGQVFETSLSYRNVDSFGAVSAESATVTFRIVGENDAPTAIDDSAILSEDDSDQNIAVLANDTDVDSGDSLTIASIDDSNLRGTAVIDGSTIKYSRNGQFDDLAVGETAQEIFSYTIEDSAGSQSSATVTLTITGLNDAPVAADDTVSVTENGSDSSIDVLANDSDVDNKDTINIASVDQSTTLGNVVLIEDQLSYDTNGQFDSLAAGETTTDTFTYTIEDSQGAPSTATVTVTIIGENDAPVAANDSVSILEDNGEIVIDVLANDTDIDNGDSLSIQSFDSTALLYGAISVTQDGKIAYMPNGMEQGLAAGQEVQETFSYVVEDALGETSTATVTLTITGQNDAPVAADDSQVLSEDDGLTTLTVFANDSDVDEGDQLVLLDVDDTASLGTVSVVDDQIQYDPNGQFESLAAGETATDTFTYTIQDSQGEQATATVTITINGVNDAPKANDDTETVDEDVDTVSINVLDNDTDVDSTDTLTIVAIDDAELIGSAVIVGDTISYNGNGLFNDLAQGEQVLETFTYTVEDKQGVQSTASVTVTVNGVNDAPIAQDDALSLSEDDGQTLITALSNDSDLDFSDTISVVSVDDTGTVGVVTLADGEIKYDPNGQFEALADGQTVTDTFSYMIEDNHGEPSTATVTVTINGKNDAPVAVDDSASIDEDDGSITIDALANDSDIDAGDSLTIDSLDDASLMYGLVSITEDGQISYALNGLEQSLAEGQQVMETFSYTLSDAMGVSSTASVTVTITGKNDAPLAPDISGHSISEDGAFAVTDVSSGLINDGSDVDLGDSVTASLFEQASNGVATVNADGTYGYTPNPNFNGTDTFKYQLTDSQGVTAIGTITVTVTAEADAPVLDNTGSLAQITAFAASGITDMAEPLGFNLSADGQFAAMVGSDGTSDVLHLFVKDEAGVFQFSESVSLTSNVSVSNPLVVDFLFDGVNTVIQIVDAQQNDVQAVAIDESSGSPVLVALPAPDPSFLSVSLSSDDTFTLGDLFAASHVSQIQDPSFDNEWIAVGNGSQIRIAMRMEQGPLLFDTVIDNTTNMTFAGSDSIALVDHGSRLFVTKDDSADIDVYINSEGGFVYLNTLVAGVDIPAMGPEQLLLSSPVANQLFILEQSQTPGEAAQLYVFDFQIGVNGVLGDKLLLAESFDVADTTDTENPVIFEHVSQFMVQPDGNIAVVSDLGNVIQLFVERSVIPDVLEDAAAPSSSTDGASVTEFLSANDVDGDDVGIAVGNVSGSGTWHYSTDGGASWLSIFSDNFDSGAVLLLDKNARIYYQPGLDESGDEVAQMDYLAWDGTEGTVGEYFMPTVFGTGSPFSDNAARLFASVESVNDAPVVTVSNDFTATGDTGVPLDASILLTEDVDTPTDSIVYTVESAPSLGFLEIFEDPDGDSVFEGRILGVGDTFTQQDLDSGVVKFEHSETTDNSTSFELSVSDGIETVSGISLNVNIEAGTGRGGNTAPTASASIVNIEQSLAAGNALAGAGRSVGDIVADSFAYDNENDPLGIAITTVINDGDGVWQYSTDGGMTFSDISDPASGNAFYLDAGAIVYYLPPTTSSGDTPLLSFHIWDQTDGNTSGTSNVIGTIGEDGAVSLEQVTVEPQLVEDVRPVLNIQHELSSDASAPFQLLQGNQFGTLIFDQELAAANNYTGATLLISSHNGSISFDQDGPANSSTGLTLLGNEVQVFGQTIASLVPGASDLTLSFVSNGGQSATQAQADEILSWLLFTVDADATGSAGATLDISDGGGSSTSTSESIFIDLTVNEAPFVSAANVPYEQSSSAEAPLPGAGKSVEFIVYETFATDSNHDPLGVAITGIDSGDGGQWFYSPDGVSSFQVLPTPIEGEAFYLAPEAVLYYQPGSAEVSATSAQLEFNIWDQSDALASGMSHELTETGGRSALSTSTAVLQVGIETDASPALHVKSGGSIEPGQTVQLFQALGTQALFFDQELAADTTDGYTGASILLDTFDGSLGFDTSATSNTGLTLVGDSVQENGQTIATLGVTEGGVQLDFVSNNGEFADQAQVDEVLSWLQFTVSPDVASSATVSFTASDGGGVSDNTFGSVFFDTFGSAT